MRQIKFRGKDLNTGDWVYGDLEIHRKDSRRLIHSYNENGDYSRQYDVDSDTIGQFTGLKDKNVADVYEGDILRVKEYKNQCMFDMTREERELFSLDELKGELEKDFISPVVWEEGCFVISSNGGDYNDYTLSVLYGNMKHSQPIFDFEVIGNIYDNPDLNKLRRL